MFARTVPSITQLVGVAVVFCTKYGWKQTAIVFSVARSSFALALEGGMLEAGVAIGMRIPVPFQASAKAVLAELRRKNLRLVFFIPNEFGDMRRWLLDFYDERMTGLGWAFATGTLADLAELKGANTYMGDDGRDADVLVAAEGLISLNPAPPASMARLTSVLTRAAMWDMQEYGAAAVPVSKWSGSDAAFAGFAYDALHALVLAADAEMRASGDVANGTLLMSHLLGGMAFDGVMGHVALDKNGDNMYPW